MVAHIRSQHEKSRHYICDLCGREFHYPQMLRAHVKTVHEKVKSDPCQFCGSVFTSKKQLLYHIEVIHKKTIINDCKICGKSFSSESHVKRHMRNVHKIFDENYKPRNPVNRLCPYEVKVRRKSKITDFDETWLD